MKLNFFGLAPLLLFGQVASAADLKFRMQEIDATLKVGYGVVIADVNGDGKPDVVVADANRVVWYENPTWKRRTMIEGAVPPDIVCIAPCDIERNGKVAFFIGADWRPFDTTTGGTIHWMRRGKTLDDPWEVFKIGEEPSVHRICAIAGDIIVAPFAGQNASKKENWHNGQPVQILRLRAPLDPTKVPWPAWPLDQSLHVVHDCYVYESKGGFCVLVASSDGLSQLEDFPRCGPLEFPKMVPVGYRNQIGVKKKGLTSVCVKRGSLGISKHYLAAIESNEGNEVATYFDTHELDGKSTRHVIDDNLRWGHALWCADLDNGGSDWIIAGVRDDLSKNPGERRGVRIYKCTDGKAEKWERQIVDDAGIACEDLTAADLNGDGKPDIIATGRQTGNVRIYWNEGRK